MYFIALPLPDPIKKLLVRQAVGLDAAWIEENDLFIQLFKMELKSQLNDLIEGLNEVDSPPFSLQLKEIGVTFRKKGEGAIWAYVQEEMKLNQLVKLIGKEIKPLKLEMEPATKILLGTFARQSDQRIANYLEATFGFVSPSFPVSSFQLIEQHNVLENFPLRS